MPRLGRYIFALCSGMSLLISVGVCVLWVRATRDPTGTVRVVSGYFPTRGARYTLRVEGDRVVVYAPPPLAPATLDEGTARTRRYDGYRPEHQGRIAGWIPACTKLPAELVADMRNDDLVWQVYRETTWIFPDVGLHFSPRGRPGSPTCQLAPRAPAVPEIAENWRWPKEFPEWRLPPYTLAQTARPLLAALEDDQAWVAAHVALDWVARRGGPPWPYGRPQNHTLERVAGHPDRFTCSIDGLHADLRAHGEEWDVEQIYNSPSFVARDCRATVGAAQRAALIERWHGRLDVVTVSFPAWQALALALVLPTTCVAGAARRSHVRRTRARRGLCSTCGYDLRATKGRCPECGTKPAPSDLNRRAVDAGTRAD